MQPQPSSDSWWTALTVWAVVNAVNILQAAGFISRVCTGSMTVNRQLGYAMIVLGIPAGAVFVAFWHAGTNWLHWAGPAMYLAFVALMVAVDYAWPTEFRSPVRYGILVPYLSLFIGSILLMGLPMFNLGRRLWFVTVGTTLLLLGSMGAAMRKGVG